MIYALVRPCVSSHNLCPVCTVTADVLRSNQTTVDSVVCGYLLPTQKHSAVTVCMCVCVCVVYVIFCSQYVGGIEILKMLYLGASTLFVLDTSFSMVLSCSSSRLGQVVGFGWCAFFECVGYVHSHAKQDGRAAVANTPLNRTVCLRR